MLWERFDLGGERIPGQGIGDAPFSIFILDHPDSSQFKSWQSSSRQSRRTYEYNRCNVPRIKPGNPDLRISCCCAAMRTACWTRTTNGEVVEEQGDIEGAQEAGMPSCDVDAQNE